MCEQVVVATTKVGIFKQITTSLVRMLRTLLLLLLPQRQEFSSKSQLSVKVSVTTKSCCCYHKGRNFQANHNDQLKIPCVGEVVVATTKVGIFKQITTKPERAIRVRTLLLLPQRQEFSSKSQLFLSLGKVFRCCCCYHKGRNFQANHN